MAIYENVVLGKYFYVHVKMTDSGLKLYRTRLNDGYKYYNMPEKAFNSLNEFILHCQLVKLNLE